METTKLAKSVNGKIIYDGTKMEMFVPDEFFKKNLAEMVGTSYYLYGTLKTIHYFGKDDDRSSGTIGALYFPAKFYTKPSEVTTLSTDFGDGYQKYTVLTYYNGDTLMSSDEVIVDAGNVSTLMKMMTEGALDYNKYKDLPALLQLAKYYNKVSFDTPAVYEEVIVSSYYRDPENVSRSARFAASNPNIDENTFFAKGLTQREKVAFTSTFSAITFEDITAMLTMADNAKRAGREEIVSEVEKVTLGRI